jgi:hypothetical protein
LPFGEANNSVRQRPGQLKLMQHQDYGEAAHCDEATEFPAKPPGQRWIDRSKGLIA